MKMREAIAADRDHALGLHAAAAQQFVQPRGEHSVGLALRGQFARVVMNEPGALGAGCVGGHRCQRAGIHRCLVACALEEFGDAHDVAVGVGHDRKRGLLRLAAQRRGDVRDVFSAARGGYRGREGSGFDVPDARPEGLERLRVGGRAGAVVQL